MWDSLSITDPCDLGHCPARKMKRIEGSFLDKENIQQALNSVKNDELSFYGNNTSTAILCTGTSPNHCTHNLISRRPLEDHNVNSRDSGFLTNSNEDSNKFSSYASPSRGSFELSLTEDEFYENFSDFEPLDDNLPTSFNKLISAPITNEQTNRLPQQQNEETQQQQQQSPNDIAFIRPTFRRALSLQPLTPNSRVRTCLFKSFKRPDTMAFESPTNSKRARFNDDDETVPSVPNVILSESAQKSTPVAINHEELNKHINAINIKFQSDDDEDNDFASVPSNSARPLLKRFVSTEESIMSAVNRSTMDPNLIGDFSKTFCLPLTPGRHQDLKSITATTLAKLIRGEFDGNVASFKVIDCRYPYEFDGGHINGAINIYTKDQCMQLLSNFTQQADQDKRNILVFHCEFSSERGPNLYRYLRNQDRQMNIAAYPSLHYPEIYLLEGGYKNFFEQFANLCVPIAYTQMLHPGHENDLKFFRQKTKSSNDNRFKSQRSLKRLGL